MSSPPSHTPDCNDNTAARRQQRTLAATLKHAPNPFPSVHHAPIPGLPLPHPISLSSPSQPTSPHSSNNNYTTSNSSNGYINDTLISSGMTLDDNNKASSPTTTTVATPTTARTTTIPFRSTTTMPSQFTKALQLSSASTPSTDASAPEIHHWFHKPILGPTSHTATATTSMVSPNNLSVPPTSTIPSPSISMATSPVIHATPLPAGILGSAPSILLSPMAVPPVATASTDTEPPTTNPPRPVVRPGSVHAPRTGPFHIHPITSAQVVQDDLTHSNPYQPPPRTSSCPFVSPKIPGYEFKGGSQAGHMGLMMGKRISDGTLVTGILQQSKVLLQHEHRIQRRLQFPDYRFEPNALPPDSSKSGADDTATSENKGDKDPSKICDEETDKDSRELGLVENGKYFNRIVEDFLEIDKDDMSILILRRLGPNILSHHHHRFKGLEETDGYQNPRLHTRHVIVGSPFPDVYTFLVFCLKFSGVLEGLQRSNIAHLCICPTSLHWSAPECDEATKNKVIDRNPCNLYHDAEPSRPETVQEMSGESIGPQYPQFKCSSNGQIYTQEMPWDVNDTKIRLFEFAHAKILSHERARAPSNIFEWQIPGYLEYHLQFLAPEQTGRAETWMDHRTDIYSLGVTLFSMLTMQYPNKGNDSVQILQGVLSRDLPPLRNFRPDMPPIIEDILRKMTQKQPSQRYQSAHGLKQDILRCLNSLHKTGTIESFPLGAHDVSFQFVLPNAIFGRHMEQQMISAAIAQAAGAYQQSLNCDEGSVCCDDDEMTATNIMDLNNSDHYVFEDDIVPLQNQGYTKIPLSSKTLLRTPKPFDGGKSFHRGGESTDPVVRAIFVSGPSGVGKTVLIRGMATVARNSGLFAGGAFEAEGSEPYSAILSCIQSVLQQLLAQHTDALASLVVAIRTAFEPNSGIGIICDLIPEVKYFFKGSEMPKSKDIPLTHSVARFHALILKLIRVISTHFFMTWLIDDIHYADENSIALLATLVNVNKRLPIVLIMTHRDTPDCLVKVKQILGGGNVTSNNHTGSYGTHGSIHQDPLLDEISSGGHSSPGASMTKTTAIRATGLPLVVRGGGGVRFIRLQNPTLETIQEFLGVLLHRNKPDVLSLATVLHSKLWLSIRQLVLELYRNHTIFFDCHSRTWEWESCSQTLSQVVRKLAGEEYTFLKNRIGALDCDTKKILICAAICGSVVSILDLQDLAKKSYVFNIAHSQQHNPNYRPVEPVDSGNGAMAGMQNALREGILIYTSNPDHLRFHHSVVRKIALEMLEGTAEKERLHFERAKILFQTPGQEFRTASHVLQCLDMVKKKLMPSNKEGEEAEVIPYWIPTDTNDDGGCAELDVHALRAILSQAGEKSQKSGAQDMALLFWNAALTLLPENCWDIPEEDTGVMDMETGQPQKTPLYYEALKLHLQCIEAERWREKFDVAMDICNDLLSKTKDPIDRARVYQHKIEMLVWAYSRPTEATKLTIRCLQELGMSKDIDFNPSHEQIRGIYNETHKMLLAHMDSLQSENPMVCTDPRIIMLMEVLSIANASLYYCNVPFLAVGVTESMRLVCKHGITKDAGRALVSFALTHSAWHGCLENAYELGRLACQVCPDNHHVKFLFHLTVQQWGDHVANSIPALEETLMAADMTCDRLFHTAGMIHVSVMRVLLARVHLRDCLAATMDLVAKQIEFGPKCHGVEVMQGILQLIKCLKGRTFSTNPDTLFDDGEFAESRLHGKRDKSLVMVHNNSTFIMLKIIAAFVFGHYAFIAEVTSSWHDDPKSMVNFEGSWIAHSILTVVGLALVNLLRTELNPEVRDGYKKRISIIHDRMETRANKYPTNHAAMFHLLQAEIADQEEIKDIKKVLLLYEKSIAYATTGEFPLQKAFCYELAAKSHLRHGLVTSGRCLLMNSCKTYQNWGATGKVNWFYKTHQEMFGSSPDIEATAPTRGLFYRPNDSDFYHSNGHPLVHSGTHTSSSSSGAESTLVGATSPWSSGSPKTMYSPGSYGNDAVLAAAAAIAESAMATSMQTGCPSATSTSSSISAPLNTLQNSWTASPQSPEMDNADLDVLDFSSVIEAMQVIASEIDLDLLLVKSLGVLNQSVGAKRCCIIISKDQELVLSASQGDLGQCVSVNPPMEVGQCASLFHGVINYVINTSSPCLLTNAKDDPRFCSDDYLKQRTDLKTVLCAPILHKTAMVGVLYMEEFPERAFANKRMLVMNLLVQQLGISITNALLYQSVLQSETKLNGLLENMPCGIALWDATAEECQYINSSWKDMTGYTVAEIMETGWHILAHADEAAIYIQHWRDRVLAGVPCQWESRYKLKDGTYRWAIVRMLPIKSPSERNKIIQWLTVTIDIDDQRRAVQLKSNFLANMSHELRTPFSGILGMLSLLRDSSGLSHEQFEFVDMAKASCEMLIRIVDDLLNFSKLEADKVTLEYIPLCFEEILGDVCDLLVPLASRKGLELIILIDDTLPLVLIGDPDRMKQILMNLIGNAIKFSTTGNVIIEFHHELVKRAVAASSSRATKTRTLMHTHGPVTVQPITKSVSTETDEKKLGDEVVLHCSVKDQGIGLSPEEQKMLFVSFQQTDNGTTRKYGGTGLGLSICAQLIAHMHGKIEVDSVKGQGATFSFTAKLRTMTPYDQEQSPAESSRIMECDVILAARLSVIKDKKVLILSPNRSLREQIVRTLNGAICSEFDNVISALESRAIGITGMEPTSAVKAGGSFSAAIPQFDFILVDHVLDTAELDRIYPSPTVAFVLLLAPTTETLRWILPPAAKKIQEEPEEVDSAQIDIGGRGRIVPASDMDVPGQMQLSPPTLISKSGLNTRDPSPTPSLTGKRSPMPRLSKKPSQLFKKRKHSRGPVTLARQEHKAQSIPEATDGDGGGDNGNKAAPAKSTSSSFQVYRLIKPVRRMKLLQILFNAITQHETGDHSVDRITELMDTDSAEDHDDGEDRSSDAYVGSSSPAYSGSGKSSRTGSPSSTDGTVDSESGLTKKRKSKFAGQKRTFKDADWSESDTSCDTRGNRTRGRSMATENLRTMEDGNMPKRARNNDALTLLLSAEERENCRGKNVLVAEDDFVSQKILEKQLSKLGMNVTIAGNGLEAVNQWLAVERGYYTIAIFDHHMPIMDGLAATKKLRALEAQEAKDSPEASLSIRIPIVGLSADIQQSTKESCIKAGMDEYMTKPLLTKGLALLIQRYCCS